MQDIGSNIDELFRKAAENYPVKPGEDNWDHIVSKISGNTTIAETTNRNQYKKYLTIMVLFLLVMFLGFYFLIPGSKQGTVSVDERQQNNSVQNKISDTKTESDLTDKISPGDVLEEKGSSQNRNQKVDISTNHSITNITSSAIPKNDKENVDVNASETGIEKENKVTVSLTLYNQKADLIPTESSMNNPAIINKIYLTGRPLKIKPITFQKNENAFISKKGMYYGLLGGPGFSAVKKGGLNKTGYAAGLLGGYRFGEKVSLEIGLLFSQKYYTSDGKYFSLKEIGPMMPAGMKVIQIEGGSCVFQFPVHFRYDVINKRDQRFFSSAGISSYLMIVEHNRYHTLFNGIEEKTNGSYMRDRRYFAPVLDFGVGYERDIGKRKSIRLEPYIQIPLKGIGVGNLPVLSTGLHIGITQSAEKPN